jgi:hypothetical protein
MSGGGQPPAHFMPRLMEAAGYWLLVAKTVPLPVSSTTSQRCGRLFAEQGDESVSQAIPETELEKNPDHAGCSGSYIFLFSMMWTVPLEACSRARPMGCRFLTFARRAAISSMLPNILSCR